MLQNSKLQSMWYDMQDHKKKHLSCTWQDKFWPLCPWSGWCKNHALTPAKFVRCLKGLDSHHVYVITEFYYLVTDTEICWLDQFSRWPSIEVNFHARLWTTSKTWISCLQFCSDQILNVPPLEVSCSLFIENIHVYLTKLPFVSIHFLTLSAHHPKKRPNKKFQHFFRFGDNNRIMQLPMGSPRVSYVIPTFNPNTKHPTPPPTHTKAPSPQSDKVVIAWNLSRSDFLMCPKSQILFLGRCFHVWRLATKQPHLTFYFTLQQICPLVLENTPPSESLGWGLLPLWGALFSAFSTTELALSKKFILHYKFTST